MCTYRVFYLQILRGFPNLYNLYNLMDNLFLLDLKLRKKKEKSACSQFSYLDIVEGYSVKTLTQIVFVEIQTLVQTEQIDL